MALGARRIEVMGLVLGQSLRMTIIGLVLGVLGALAGARYLSGMLFGVAPTDVTTFGGVAALFAIVALVAVYIPAYRATRVDPLIALRCE
jgi:putative ABC transport system permease protein